jgi:hypothetical protein
MATPAEMATMRAWVMVLERPKSTTCGKVE